MTPETAPPQFQTRAADALEQAIYASGLPHRHTSAGILGYSRFLLPEAFFVYVMFIALSYSYQDRSYLWFIETEQIYNRATKVYYDNK